MKLICTNIMALWDAKILLKNQHDIRNLLAYIMNYTLNQRINHFVIQKRKYGVFWLGKRIFYRVFGSIGLNISIEQSKGKRIFLCWSENECLHTLSPVPTPNHPLAFIVTYENPSLFIFIDFQIILLILCAPLNAAFNKKQNPFSP